MLGLNSTKLALTAASFFALAASANATDLLDGLNDPAPQGTAVNWSGFYLGGAIGYGNANHDLTAQDYFKDFCTDETAETISKVTAEEILASDVDGSGEQDKKSGVTYDREQTLPEGCSGNEINVVSGASVETATLDGLNSTGIVGDIRAGYDQQLSNRFLVGVFGTYGFSNMDADGSVAGVGSFKLERGDDWSVGARAGVLVNDSTLLYALAAYTQTEYDLSVTDGAATFSKTTTFDGITVGAGIELAVANNVFLGIEGTHTFYDDETIFDAYNADANVGTSVIDDLGETKILGTLKIKLNSF